MNYGWLSETTLIPKEAKKINVDKSSLLGIQAFIEKEKKKRGKQPDITGVRVKALFKEEDQEDNSKLTEEEKRRIKEREDDEILHKQSRAVLLKKAQIYEKLKNSQSSKLTKEKYLIDFDQHRQNEFESTKDYETKRAQFYQSLLDEKKKEALLNQRPAHIELSRNLINQEQERLDWEKDMLQNIDCELDELSNLRKRHFIRQAYDKTMSSGAKDELEKISSSQKLERCKLEQIREMRNAANQKRLEKLKKLKLLDN